jgi:hypothetical protein
MATKTKRVAIYLRVSTDGQTIDNQRLAPEAVAAQRGWTVVAVYEDLDSTGDDHAADGLRYAVASWPWVEVEQTSLFPSFRRDIKESG